MRRLQVRDFLALAFLCENTHGHTVVDSRFAQITPPPQFERRAQGTEASSVCGHITGDYRSPLAWSSGLSCSSYSSQYGEDPGQFNCCDSRSCYNDYTKCVGSTSVTGSTSSCADSDSRCLACTGTNSECVIYHLDYGTGDLRDYYAYISRACGPTSTVITVRSSVTNAPATTITCVPAGFDVPPSTESCASQAVLLIPLIVSNVVVLAANVVLSRLRFQNKIKFCSKPSTADDDWTPWSGLSTVALVIVQAIASAALIRAGGYPAAWANLILLWLLRPRMQWSVMLLYNVLGEEYRRAATDYSFADGILTLLSIPIAAWMLQAAHSSEGCINGGFFSLGGSYVLSFGDVSGRAGQGFQALGLLRIAIIVCLAFSGVDLFIFATFCVKRRLSRGWAIGAGFWSMAIFGASWFFWIAWISFAGTDFCVSNVGALSAIHAAIPLISGIFRAWLT